MEKRFQKIELYNQNSGTNTKYNYGQSAGIEKTKAGNKGVAECYIAVCEKPLIIKVDLLKDIIIPKHKIRIHFF